MIPDVKIVKMLKLLKSKKFRVKLLVRYEQSVWRILNCLNFRDISFSQFVRNEIPATLYNTVLKPEENLLQNLH